MRLRTFVSTTLAVALFATLLGAAGSVSAQDDPCDGVLCAGFARIDITWHVAGAQGQYSDFGNTVLSNKFDPYVHNVHTEPQDGIQSRSYARAFVVQGPDGTRAAYIGHDLYLQQDVLTRRVAQLVEGEGVGIDGSNLMIGASHNHSSTSLGSTAWGVWLFTDVLDYRFFDFVSKRLSQVVVDAASDLRPVRIGAAVSRFDTVQQNILGPKLGDDGTPAGFPRDHFDDELAVVRFDDVTDPENPTPLGMLVNLGNHPESIDDGAMPSADFVGMVERMVSRETGAAVVWSQGAVGDIEPDRSARANPPEEKREYWHRDFAQAEKMSRIIADAVVDTWAEGDTTVPYTTDAPVAMVDAVFGGPASHPVPTVSNCRTEAAAGGEVGIPVLGLPDCERVPGPDGSGLYDMLGEHGIPVPVNYGVSGYGGAQESLNAHLQVMRIGEIVLATCPCEPVTDMAVNFKTRANSSTGDIFDGFDWPCRPAGEDYECNYATASYRPDDWRPVSTELYERMRAQVHNDAAGWDDEDPESILRAEHEPDDPSEIKGNFTKTEIQSLGVDGYTLPLMVGQANDYIGYIVTYREHQAHDHYRKALTPFGPHSADYVNTRLVRMAAHLKGADAPDPELTDAMVLADGLANDGKATALGEAAAAAVDAYEAALPDDGGDPGIISMRELSDPRFDGAQVRWVGGSIYTDVPNIVVERRVECSTEPCDEAWEPFANQDGGEVILNVFHRPNSAETAATWAIGDLATAWQATLEVFEQTPIGTYRFVIDGHHRSGGEAVPYHLVSDPFTIRPWAGIVATDGAYDFTTDVASFAVEPITYPRTWEGIGVPYISHETSETATGEYCFRCTFRPWAESGEVATAMVTVRHATGGEDHYPATFDGSRWVADGVIATDTDTVVVDTGDVTDTYGNINGEPLVLYELPLGDGR